MEMIEKTIEVDAPLRKVYNQWTQFEEFPRFMDGVEQVQQTDDRHLHWVAKLGGQRKEWDAEIIEQVPDHHIAWRSVSGSENAGVVHFQPVDHNHTRITVQMKYEPEGAAERIGGMFGFMDRKVEEDLKRFKAFIQERSTETGAWRGEISGGGAGKS